MNNRRRLLIALGTSALASPFASIAEQQEKIRRIGYLGARSRSTAANPDPYQDAFVDGMRTLGYVEGRNLKIEWRFAENKLERLPELATQLAALNLEVIVTHATPAVSALSQATKTVPIVTASMGEPIAGGFTTSLSRPSGNITGLSPITIDLLPKQLELLKTMVPALSRVAFVTTPGNLNSAARLQVIQDAGKVLGIHIAVVEANSPEEIEQAFATIRREKVQAILVQAATFFIGSRRRVADLTVRSGLPSMFAYREDVLAGGLMSYGQNTADQHRRSATFVDKILKGAKPGDLPIEQPTKIILSINRKAASRLRIKIPQSLLISADEVFE